MHVISRETIVQLALNICMLSVLASLLSKIQYLQKIILQENRSIRAQALLSVVFAGMIMLSCSTGIMVGKFNINTKVIGALAAGLLGGPLIGLYASLIGAVYVYVFSPYPQFAMATAYSTVLFGLLGGGFYPYFQRGKWKYTELFLLACFAEACEIIAILRMTVPFEMALNTVLEISIPMILINAAGILIFISSFQSIFVTQDIESSRQLQHVSGLMERCFYSFDGVLKEGDTLKKFAEAVLNETGWLGIMFTDTEKVLEWRYVIKNKDDKDIYTREMELFIRKNGMENIPEIGKLAISQKKMISDYVSAEEPAFYEQLKDLLIMAVPVSVKNQVVGCIVVWIKRQWVLRQSEETLLQNLGMICSYQVTLTELEHQNTMRQKAEFKALQFQVNPHFLFNALNTISYICRENSAQARNLILTLADYFRYNLNSDAYFVLLEREVEHVKDYLEIEKARFEDKLLVTYSIPDRMDIEVPTLILQPIVENAVRHGIGKDGVRHVDIWISEKADSFQVIIQDHGSGFPKVILEKLYSNQPFEKSVGLSNVHKRLMSIYGEENGLQIESSEKGSSVKMKFLKKGF